jgi:hypothetical protein
MNLQTLLAEREIQRALSQFAWAMDERNWECLATILTEDAKADMGAGPLDGRDAIISSIRRYLDVCGPTQHLLGNLLIEVDGDTARSRCYVSDMHLGAGPKAHLTFCTLGDYHDRWQKIDGRWRMVERRKYNHAHVGTLGVFEPGAQGAR